MKIEEFIIKENLPKYKIDQFNQSIYKDLISSFDELSTWSKSLRENLKKEAEFSTIIKEIESISKDRNTIKVLFKKISNQNKFETVLMKHKDGRNTVCVSCMVGCPIGCAFCATGKMGFIENLTSQEIIDQVLYFARILKKENKKVTNIVYMGMGEPLLNFDNVLNSIKILNDQKYFGLGIRKIAISTSGITDKILKLINIGYKGKLTLSLHAPNQKLRETLIPIAKNYPLPKLLNAMYKFSHFTKRRINMEYILIKNINDKEENAKELVKLLQKNDVHINLIPYNEVKECNLKKSETENIKKFSNILTLNKIENTIRVTMGDDIKAACGQLAGN